MKILDIPRDEWVYETTDATMERLRKAGFDIDNRQIIKAGSITNATDRHEVITWRIGETVVTYTQCR
jgi:hypothetical protein